MEWRRRHVLGLSDFHPEEMEFVIDTARSMEEVVSRDIKKVPALRGKTVVNLFFEASTRTRTSFELAGKRLSADVVNVAGSSSSTTKGETLRDTVLTPDATQPRAPRTTWPPARGPRWSTPATAPTSTPPRRCSTPSPSAGARGSSRV